MLNKLGKYEIRRELGRGAMGIVYEGFDPFIERTVAIKTVHKSLLDQSEAQEVLGRFRREAQAAGRLSHPNIVSVYEYGEDNDIAFIAMEYVVGTELKDYFGKTERFPLSDCIKIMVQLLGALEYSHARGVVHRDIKPANILITKDGQVKIADFGIARIESSDLTQAGTVLGTPSYMSPEQFLGQAVDRRSDIYSAGIILYQFLTGVRPFSGSNMSVIMHKVLNEAPADIGTFNPALPKALQAVVGRAIAKRPEDRYQTAAEFMKALELAAGLPDTPAAGVSGDSEATMKITKPDQGSQKSGPGIDLIADFSMDDFEARLKETQREANRRAGIREQGEQSAMPLKETRQGAGEPDELAGISLSEVKLNFDQFIPDKKSDTYTKTEAPASAATVVPLQAEAGASSLLAGLAQEARKKQDAKQSTMQESLAKAKQVDDALQRIVKYFVPFIKHVNEVEPAINRTYRYDARTVFENLKWQDATLDYRKQSISESALTEYVVLSVNLCAPEPVPIRRPWGPLDNFKKELQQLRLRVMEDAESADNKRKPEWLEARLAPDFPVQMRFQANYRENHIDVLCRNIEAFGVASYKLAPDDVASAFLDGMGLFLLGRSDKLPAQLRRI